MSPSPTPSHLCDKTDGKDQACIRRRGRKKKKEYLCGASYNIYILYWCQMKLYIWIKLCVCQLEYKTSSSFLQIYRILKWNRKKTRETICWAIVLCVFLYVCECDVSPSKISPQHLCLNGKTNIGIFYILFIFPMIYPRIYYIALAWNGSG